MSAGALVAGSSPASAALQAVGPTDPATGFPSYYTDSNGVSLDLCLDGLPLCLAAADELVPDDGEAFYFAADAEAGPFTGHFAIEAAYFPPQPVVFERRQFQADGLRAGDVYTITHPYGVDECVATAGRTRCRFEVGGIPDRPQDALGGKIGPFLVSASGAPAGYIGDNATPVPVTGSPTGFNVFRVEGPGIASTCAGGTIPNCAETEEFILQGKLAAGPAARVDVDQLDFGNTAAPVTKTVTYTSIGTAAATPSVSASGAFSATAGAGCDSVAPGAACTISVTYTPVSGQSATGALSITDNTAASPRSVALTGRSVPVTTLSTVSLAFDGRKVDTGPSAAKAVTVRNTGVAPLTVSNASSSNADFAVANGCTGPVAPGASCDVSVSFAPAAAGASSGTLTITDSTGPHAVSLSGTGTQPVAAAPSGITFADTAVSSSRNRVVRVRNSGDAPLVFDSRSLSGPNAADFRLAGAAQEPCVAGLSVAPGAWCEIAVRFAPRALGDRSAALTVRSDGGTRTVRLGGEGVDRTAPRVLARTPLGGVSAFSRTGNVSARFSESVRGVGRASFTLTNRVTGRTVRAAVTRVGTSNRWVLDPGPRLASRTRYTARLVGGPRSIRDQSGNALRTTAWTFRTRR